MPEYIQARFVGGPWHNRVSWVPRTKLLHHVWQPLTTVCVRPDAPVDHKLEIQDYYLCKFVTGRHVTEPCSYYEYVHESLMDGANPKPEVYAVKQAPKLPGRISEIFMRRLCQAVLNGRRRK